MQVIRFALSIIGYLIAIIVTVYWAYSDKTKNKMIDRRDRRLGDLMRECEFFSERCENQTIMIGKLQREIERLTRLSEAEADDGK